MADAANLLRDAVTKIPIWTGDKNDAFTPEQWLLRVEKAALAAGWNDVQTMSFVYVSMRGEALVWYDCLKRSGIADTYVGFKQAFLTSYEPALTARTACVTMADIKQGVVEKTVNYYARVIKIIDQINTLLPQAARRPADQVMPGVITALQGYDALAQNVRDTTVTGFIDYGLKAMADHVGIQLFVAGLRPKLRDELMKQMPNTLWAAFSRAMELEKISGPPTIGAAAVNAIDEDEDSRMTEEINAIQARLTTMLNRRNFARGNRPNQSGAGKNAPRGSGNKNDLICRCCNKRGHAQDVCYTRIKKGLPCVDVNGVPLKNQPPPPPPKKTGKVNEVAEEEKGEKEKEPPQPGQFPVPPWGGPYAPFFP